MSTVRHHAGDRHAAFLADFLGNCAIAFPICLLMLQKCAFRYFGPLWWEPDFWQHAGLMTHETKPPYADGGASGYVIYDADLITGFR
jgi:hypothetical protein